MPHVASNAYAEKGLSLPQSMGVTVGRRTVVQDGRPYTLIAVVPRSISYGVEWVSNFTVGTGSIHEGFRNGRDEVLAPMCRGRASQDP